MGTRLTATVIPEKSKTNPSACLASPLYLEAAFKPWHRKWNPSEPRSLPDLRRQRLEFGEVEVPWVGWRCLSRYCIHSARSRLRIKSQDLKDGCESSRHPGRVGQRKSTYEVWEGRPCWESSTRPCRLRAGQRTVVRHAEKAPAPRPGQEKGMHAECVGVSVGSWVWLSRAVPPSQDLILGTRVGCP